MKFELRLAHVVDPTLRQKLKENMVARRTGPPPTPPPPPLPKMPPITLPPLVVEAEEEEVEEVALRAYSKRKVKGKARA